MAEVVYRQATVADVPVLAQLRWEMEVERHPDEAHDGRYAPYISAFVAQCAPEFTAGRHQAWLAEVDGLPVACAILIPWVMPPSMGDLQRRRGFVSSVYTRPEYRRQGIARHIMDLLIASAREQHITRLILWASEMGRDLYVSMGFVPSRGYEYNFER